MSGLMLTMGDRLVDKSGYGIPLRQSFLELTRLHRLGTIDEGGGATEFDQEGNPRGIRRG